MNFIKLIFISLILLVSIKSFSKDIYKIKIMGKFEGETVKLPNDGKFNMFTAKAAFTDSDGNYGDSIGRGVREIDKNNKIVNLYVIITFETSDGSSMMVRPIRTESDIKVGTGSYKIAFATGVFKKYIGMTCKYGITTTKGGAFIQENICKL